MWFASHDRIGLRLPTHPAIDAAIDTAFAMSGAPLEDASLSGMDQAFAAGIAIISRETFAARYGQDSLLCAFGKHLEAQAPIHSASLPGAGPTALRSSS